MDSFDSYHVLLDIPKGERPVTHYQLLGLEPGERDPEVIQRAADRRMVCLKSQQVGRHIKLVQRLLNEVATAKTSLLKLDPRPPEPTGVVSDVVPPMARPPIADPKGDVPDSETFVPRASSKAVVAYRRRTTRKAPVAAIAALSLAVLLGVATLYAFLW